MAGLLHEVEKGADIAILTEEVIRDTDVRPLAAWVEAQAPWSDLPFVILTEHGGGVERNPAAAHLTSAFGNVTFLERPFHPTTLISVVQTGLRGRARQYECRHLNEELEARVQQRTAELAAVNRQLQGQIEERERVESTLRQMQRLEAVGQLTSGVAHDFNNLLTVVLGNIAFLEKGLVAAGLDKQLMQRLGQMRIAAERGAKLTDQLLSFSRRQRLEPMSLDINAAVTSMHDLLHSTMGGSVRIETRLGTDVWPALVDPTQLELAILNLAINARDAMEVGGTLTIRTSNVHLGAALCPEEPSPGEYVEICVADTGTGMSEEIRSKAFEPFFTTKGVGRGSGLGLSQVLGFAKQSGGGLRLETRINEGTTLHIYLHRANTQSVSIAPRRKGTPAGRIHDATILVVDDDDAVRDIAAGLLREEGYSVFEARSGGSALEIIERETKIDLMLIDFAMPGMNGAELARQVRTTRTTLPILFMTGFADRTAMSGVSDTHLVRKPFVDDELAKKVRAALGSSEDKNVVHLSIRRTS